jgi:hypothetical protein
MGTISLIYEYNEAVHGKKKKEIVFIQCNIK